MRGALVLALGILVEGNALSDHPVSSCPVRVRGQGSPPPVPQSLAARCPDRPLPAPLLTREGQRNSQGSRYFRQERTKHWRKVAK